jgi:hypothetical protein
VKSAGLAFEQAPAAAVPLRFLLTAPWFLALAGLVLVFGGADALASRWTPSLLAVTHLVTLGFMSMIMIGALFQLLPVVAGAPVRRAQWVAGIVHPALTAGTLSLAAGFLLGSPWALRAAAALLALAFAVFIAAAGAALLHSTVRDPSVRAMRLALIALIVTVALGLSLAAALGWRVSAPLLGITAQHAAWGLAGWTMLLAIGVALQVVPMFQLTPSYPKAVASFLAPGLFVALAGWSVAFWLGWTAVAAALGVLVALLVGAFAVATLILQHRSRRQHDNPTFLTWRAGMLGLLLAAAVWIGRDGLEAVAANRAAVLLGVLFLAGFAASVIAGMLYNIVPFLLWIDLRRRAHGRVPHMKQILPDAPVRTHAWLHVASLVALVAAALWPAWLAPVAGVLVVSANALLGTILSQAALRARRVAPASA